MKLLFAKIQWLRVAVSSFFIIIFSFLVITIIIAGYAFILAFEFHGSPDQTAINHFAASVSQWMMPLLEIIFTFVVAFISAKKTLNTISLHSILIGIFAGLLSTMIKLGFASHLNYRTYIFFFIIVGSGFVGGILSQRQRAKKMKEIL